MHIGEEALDLRLTLMDSAQCFSWQEMDGRFGAVLDGKPVWLWSQPDGIHAQGASLEFLRDYLDLNRDYAALAQEYAQIPMAKCSMEMISGLRILNQSPWDALITFILSANNNVQRIRKLVQRLCERFGERFDTQQGTLYAFPTPERLAATSEEELRALGVGYRAPYLIGTARTIAEGFPLSQLKHMSYPDAHARLTELPGVGDKVADCVLLFGCRHASAFPVDVWVEKLLKSWFGLEATTRKRLQSDSRKLLGEHAGLLQQFMFHAARTGMIPVDAPAR